MGGIVIYIVTKMTRQCRRICMQYINSLNCVYNQLYFFCNVATMLSLVATIASMSPFGTYEEKTFINC